MVDKFTNEECTFNYDLVLFDRPSTGTWTIDKSPQTSNAATPSMDEDGWSYGTNFAQLREQYATKTSSGSALLSFARRRRWIRKGPTKAELDAQAAEQKAQQEARMQRLQQEREEAQAAEARMFERQRQQQKQEEERRRLERVEHEERLRRAKEAEQLQLELRRLREAAEKEKERQRSAQELRVRWSVLAGAVTVLVIIAVVKSRQQGR